MSDVWFLWCALGFGLVADFDFCEGEGLILDFPEDEFCYPAECFRAGGLFRFFIRFDCSACPLRCRGGLNGGGGQEGFGIWRAESFRLQKTASPLRMLSQASGFCFRPLLRFRFSLCSNLQARRVRLFCLTPSLHIQTVG